MREIKPITNFLEGKEFAIAGVSRNEKKFGYQVYKHLKDNGYKVYPINPNTDSIAGEQCYPDIAALPAHLKKLYVVTPKDQTTKVMEEAASRGFEQIWIQQMSDTSDARKMADEKKIDLITGECMFMYAEPVKSVHKFHRWINKLFGRYPK